MAKMGLTKAFLVFPEHWNFMVCQDDDQCFDESLPCIAEITLPQLLSSESESTRNEKNIDIARYF